MRIIKMGDFARSNIYLLHEFFLQQVIFAILKKITKLKWREQ